MIVHTEIARDIPGTALVVLAVVGCMFVLMRMAQKAKLMFLHDPRRPARYSLIPRDVRAYRWLGQDMPGICRKTDCFDLGVSLNTHIHTGPYAFKLVEHGDWVCQDIEGGRLWVSGDTWFVENYRPSI
jgi:hypothetical protein